MKRKSILFGWMIVFLSLSSCVSYEKYSMEVFKPGERNLPKDMHKVALVARNLKYTIDTLQDYQAKNHRLYKDKIKFNVDSVTITTCFDSLSARLLDQHQFDSVLVLPQNMFPVTRIKQLKPGKAEWYEDLARQTNADGLIVLDMFSCFYSVYNEGISADVIASNIWSVYDARRKKIIDRYTQIDTLYWDQRDENGIYRTTKIPNKKMAVSLAAGVIGENYAKRFVPSWRMVYRDVMTCSNPDLKKAANLALKNKWDDAIAVWQKAESGANRRNKLIATYNLALSSEMNGNVDLAIEYLKKAAELSSKAFRSLENEAVRKYAVVLEQRKNEIRKLENQDAQ